jgi:hypothetical protein
MNSRISTPRNHDLNQGFDDHPEPIMTLLTNHHPEIMSLINDLVVAQNQS